MAQLITTQGELGLEQLGMILPHEHIFVDLRTPDTEGYAQAESTDVITLMSPEIEKAKLANITALVACTPTGVGRRVDLVKAVSDATNFPIVVPTGIYREPWVPEWVYEASEDEIYEWMVKELTIGVKSSGVRAGWIKLSAGDDGLTDVETKILRAAARAGKATGAVIGSHTIRHSVVKHQLEIIESVGYTPERFIWIHTQAEVDVQLHIEIAKRGAWIEYDWIGLNEDYPDSLFIDYIREILDAGLGNQLLLSQDRGWFDPAKPNGGIPRSFTYLTETFLPKLKEAGIKDDEIKQLTHINPFHAFAR